MQLNPRLSCHICTRGMRLTGLPRNSLQTRDVRVTMHESLLSLGFSCK